MSVEEFATHIRSSRPGGRSRERPGRFNASTSQFRASCLVSTESIVVSVKRLCHDEDAAEGSACQECCALDQPDCRRNWCARGFSADPASNVHLIVAGREERHSRTDALLTLFLFYC